MPDLVVRGIFDGLVRRAGGVDAVAAVLEARYGVGCKGTVSKMCAGHLAVTVDAVVAVEDFVGAYPMTRRLQERVGQEARAFGCLKELAALSSVASGQAHAALIRAFSPHGEGGEAMTDGERAEVIAQMRAAREVLDDIIASAEAGS